MLKTVEALQDHRARPLRLRRLDVFPVAIPLKQPMKMAGVLLTAAENLMLRIEAEDGSFGWGEAASAPTMTGETLWGMASAAKLIWEAIAGTDLRFRRTVYERARKAVFGNPSAQSAVEMALLDLAGHALGVNAAELLGGRHRDCLVPMWLIGHASVEADVADALAQQAAGFSFFKLKVGTKTIEADIEAARRVRAALGPAAILCADANGGLALPAALRFAHEAAEADLAFFEQPLPAHRLDDMARLQAASAIPIGADEGIHTLADIEAHATAKAAKGVSLKLIKLGGLEAGLKAAARCAELGLSVNVAAKVAETSLGSAASAHLACAIADVDWGISLTQVYLAEDPVLNPMQLCNGTTAPPEGPGLGIEVDENAVRRHRAPPP